MVVSASLVLVLGAVIAVLLRYRVVRPFDLIICGTFGFLLAGTGLGPLLGNALAIVATAFGSIQL